MILVQGITDTGTLACLVPVEQVDEWRRTIAALSLRPIDWKVSPVQATNVNDALTEQARRG